MINRMKVFVLMSDGGYDGDSLMGAYTTEDKAREAAVAFAEDDEYFDSEDTYIEAVEVDAAADQRQTAIERSHEGERRRRMVQELSD